MVYEKLKIGLKKELLNTIKEPMVDLKEVNKIIDNFFLRENEKWGFFQGSEFISVIGNERRMIYLPRGVKELIKSDYVELIEKRTEEGNILIGLLPSVKNKGKKIEIVKNHPNLGILSINPYVKKGRYPLIIEDGIVCFEVNKNDSEKK